MKKNKYLKPKYNIYHILTDGQDREIEGTSELEEELIAEVKQLAKTNSNIWLVKDTDWNSLDGFFEDQETIFSQGEFPNF